MGNSVDSSVSSSVDNAVDSLISEQALADETVQGRQEPGANHRHELREVSVRVIAIGAAVLIAGGVIVLPTLWGLLRFYGGHPERPAVAPAPVALIPREPPPPRLQESPPANYAAFLKGERTELNSSGWVDRAHNVARIPIEAAKEELLRHGVPTQPPSVAATPGSNGQQAVGGQR